MTHPVYLLDDDEAVRHALALLLSTVGIEVTGFADPQAFLARAPKLAPGCLILDIRMPAISGLKLQERLVAQGIDWPTIVISGHGDIEACRRAFRNGAGMIGQQLPASPRCTGKRVGKDLHGVVSKPDAYRNEKRRSCDVHPHGVAGGVDIFELHSLLCAAG